MGATLDAVTANKTVLSDHLERFLGVRDILLFDNRK